MFFLCHPDKTSLFPPHLPRKLHFCTNSICQQHFIFILACLWLNLAEGFDPMFVTFYKLTLPIKCLGSVSFQQGPIKLIKGDLDIYNVTKYCSFELPIHQNKKEKKVSCFPQTILSSRTVFNIINNQKCSLSSKSLYYIGFWRFMWHWKLEEWCWKFSSASQK